MELIILSLKTKLPLYWEWSLCFHLPKKVKRFHF